MSHYIIYLDQLSLIISAVPLVAFLVFGTEEVSQQSLYVLGVTPLSDSVAIYGGVVFLAKVDETQTTFKYGKRRKERGYNKHHRHPNIN